MGDHNYHIVFFKRSPKIVVFQLAAVRSCQWILLSLFFFLIINSLASCNNNSGGNKNRSLTNHSGAEKDIAIPGRYKSVYSILILPRQPLPGQPFRVLAAGNPEISKAKIIVKGSSGTLKSVKKVENSDIPYWRIDDFEGNIAGKYSVTLVSDGNTVKSIDFTISAEKESTGQGGSLKDREGWDSSTEVLYSCWISALFHGCGEDASWPALHDVIRDRNHNFLFNYFSQGEDDPGGKNLLVMQPDCADNPFFLRAYFSWKMGLPFGYHVCDHGYIGKNPKPGQWVMTDNTGPKRMSVQSFNLFLRRVMNDVHSGTGRTSLDDDNSDYYPVALERESLIPGVVYADPYGHTFTLIGWKAQSDGHPGILLAVDAQPDGTVAVKRFWKGNFLFNTSEVVGEPGFKAFRPVSFQDGEPKLLKNKDINISSGFIPFSLQQRKMETDVFYRTMERLINPRPLDPETALLNQIEALHEQLLVRVNSVGNGENYMKKHPGTVIPMPSSATGIFLAGGQWEDFSTPNRDLRLLIAMDAVLALPDLIVTSPGDFDISGLGSPEKARNKLQTILKEKSGELSISYTRTDGSIQKLSLGEILARKDAFEMTYNPNDGIEIRWGAPPGSEEISTCHRHAPAKQTETMLAVRKWFHKRLHPPT
jgi:hypothetical protein